MFSLASIARRTALCTLALALPMCTSAGTETDNPLVDFGATECKHGEELSLAPGVARTTSALDMPAEEYKGLFCYAWQVNDGGTITFDVINYKSGCTIYWAPGRTVVDSAHVELGIQNSSCAVAACGSCSYDLTFEVTGVTRDVPADVGVVERDCDGKVQDWQGPNAVQLPTDREPEGIVCRQVIDAFPPECGGTRQPPCVDPDSPYEFGTCEEDGCGEGLACVEDALDEYDLCFTACEEDADCTLAIESCQDGACRLRETF